LIWIKTRKLILKSKNSLKELKEQLYLKGTVFDWLFIE
jgi:hypothetical protein